MNSLLIVTDDEAVKTHLEAYLSHHGYNVASADNTAAAVAQTKRGAPQLIIFAMEISNGHGLDLYRGFKNTPALSHLPVMLYCGKAIDAGLQDPASIVETDFLLLKPLANDDLIQAIANLINRDTPSPPLTHMTVDQTNEDVRHQQALISQLDGKIRELEIEQQRLRRSEQQYRTLHESLRDGFVMFNLDGSIRDYNDSFRAMLGYEDRRLQSMQLASLTPERWHDQDQAQLSMTLSTGHSDVFQKELTRSDASLLPVELRLFRVNDTSEHQCGIGAIVRDISLRKQTDTELERYRDHLEDLVNQRSVEMKQARDKAESANQAKSIFLANISHELRTPLNPILGFTDILLKDANTTASQKTALNLIQDSANHLLRLIDDILEITKIETNRISLAPTTFDIWALIRDSGNQQKIRASNKGLLLNIELGDELPRYVIGDESKIRQILINLLSNAIKATERGSITLRVHISPDFQPRMIIEVEDSGCGIPIEQQQRIFEPFLQIGQQNSQQGTGLGLAITRHFVELMNGHIQLDSRPGHGSRFRVEFAIKLAPGHAIAAAPPSEQIMGLAPDQPQYRILVMEDRENNHLLLMQLLAGLGFEVCSARHVADMQAKIERWHPNLLWIDPKMRLMDELDAAEQLHTLSNRHALKIVTSGSDQKLAGLRLDAILSKPLHAAQIINCIEQVLGVKFDRHPAASAPQIDGDRTENDTAALSEPLRQQLIDALLLLEKNTIDTVITAIAAESPKLASRLDFLAQQFEFGRMLEMLKQDDRDST